MVRVVIETESGFIRQEHVRSYSVQLISGRLES